MDGGSGSGQGIPPGRTILVGQIIPPSRKVEYLAQELTLSIFLEPSRRNVDVRSLSCANI